MKIVWAGERLSELSARYGVPGCAILRANRLFSESWFTPGREAEIPGADFCRGDDDFPCPALSLFAPAKERTEDTQHDKY